jgi:hypothetical protein
MAIELVPLCTIRIQATHPCCICGRRGIRARCGMRGVQRKRILRARVRRSVQFRVEVRPDRQYFVWGRTGWRREHERLSAARPVR